MILVLEVY